VLVAQRQLLEDEGLEFNITYFRKPFFLRRDIAAWRRDRGMKLPPDATRGDVAEAMGWKPVDSDGRLGKLFDAVGMKPYWGAQEADTMDSHRMAWYASSLSPDTGERMWRALSERYFEGKHTNIRPIRYDNHDLLLECAAEAGLDLAEARRVLQSDAYYSEVHESFMDMQRAGINSIPVLIFEPATQGNLKGESRVVHHGSGNAAEFKEILQTLHRACTTPGAL